MGSTLLFHLFHLLPWKRPLTPTRLYLLALTFVEAFLEQNILPPKLLAAVMKVGLFHMGTPRRAQGFGGGLPHHWQAFSTRRRKCLACSRKLVEASMKISRWNLPLLVKIEASKSFHIRRSTSTHFVELPKLSHILPRGSTYFFR